MVYTSARGRVAGCGIVRTATTRHMDAHECTWTLTDGMGQPLQLGEVGEPHYSRLCGAARKQIERHQVAVRAEAVVWTRAHSLVAWRRLSAECTVSDAAGSRLRFCIFVKNHYIRRRNL